MAAIEGGLYQPSMKARMAELEHERTEITARLAEAPAGIPDVHPGIAEIYKRKAAGLTETLHDPHERLEASTDIRSLIGKNVLHAGAKRREVHAALHGSPMGILAFVNDHSASGTSRASQRQVRGSPGTQNVRSQPVTKRVQQMLGREEVNMLNGRQRG